MHANDRLPSIGAALTRVDDLTAAAIADYEIEQRFGGPQRPHRQRPPRDKRRKRKAQRAARRRNRG